MTHGVYYMYVITIIINCLIIKNLLLLTYTHFRHHKHGWVPLSASLAEKLLETTISVLYHSTLFYRLISFENVYIQCEKQKSIR